VTLILVNNRKMRVTVTVPAINTQFGQQREIHPAPLTCAVANMHYELRSLRNSTDSAPVSTNPVHFALASPTRADE